MNKKIFRKILSANDVGATGTHQAGILVPRTNTDLLAFLPELNSSIKNPDAWIICIDEDGNERKFRFIYYNNKFHDENGTRNEYRITYMTSYFRSVNAKESDIFEISQNINDVKFFIRTIRSSENTDQINDTNLTPRIKIRSSWRRVH